MTRHFLGIPISGALGRIFWLLALLAQLLSTAESAQSAALFSSASHEPSEGVGNRLAEARPDIGLPVLGGSVLRERRAKIGFQHLHAAQAAFAGDPGLGGSLELNLFEGVNFEAVNLRAAPTASGFSLAGDLNGVPFGTLTLVANGGLLIGTVRTPSAIYAIDTAADGSALIRQVNPSDLPPLGEPLAPPVSDGLPGRNGMGQVASTHPSGEGSDDELSVLDVLVVYTPAVLEDIGGRARIEAVADLNIAAADQAFADSGVQLRFFLTRTMEVGYEETGISYVDLPRLRTPDDGHLDIVHEWREMAGADVVHMFALIQLCGLAYQVRPRPASESRMFGVNHHVCPAILAHEIGHNLGIHHDRYVYRQTPATEFAHGYVNQHGLGADVEAQRRWLTIMATHNQCHDRGLACTQVLRYSNPDQSLVGDALGVPAENARAGPEGPADARRALNEGRLITSAYRSAVSDLTVVSELKRSALQPGDSVTLQARVTNRGRIDAPEAQGTYYRSSDPDIGPHDTALGRFESSGIPGRETVAASFSFEAPQDPGNHYFGACVDAVATERDAGNNCSSGVRATVGPTVSVSDARSDEGNPVAFRVELSEARETDVEVFWETVGGRAVEGIDFRRSNRGRLTIPAGESAGTIAVNTVPDDAAEADDTFAVRLIDARPASPAGVVLSIDGSTAVGTIVDNDGEPDIVESKLRNAIRQELGAAPNSPITVEDLESLTRIWASGRGLESLNGLEAATNVTTGWFWNNRIADLSPLAHLGRLEQLIIGANPLASLAPLTHIGSLRDLRIRDTGSSDLSELRALGGLRILELRENGIADLSPLAGSTRLIQLDLSINQISDLSPLAGLTKLRKLYLAHNAISSISALANLTGLHDLKLQGNRIATLSPLSSMPFLHSLDLGGNRVTDAAPLADLQYLTRLALAGNKIRDAGPLANLPRLRHLDLSDNEVTDLAPLLANEGLGVGDTLNVIGNPLGDEALSTQIPALRERGINVVHIGASVAAGSALEGQTISFPVRLTHPAEEDLELEYAVTPLSASEGEDYSDGGSGRVSLAAGETQASIDVYTNSDEHAEPHEALSVTVSAPEQGLPGGVEIVGATAGGIIVDAAGPATEVPLFAPAGHASRQGFVRILNGGAGSAVRIDAFDDSASADAATLSLLPGETAHLNSGDLEQGNAAKGLVRGVGDGQGNWRLEVRGDRIDALTYVRTQDGFLTSLHDLVSASPDGYAVPIFNPGRNMNQVSMLRLSNPGAVDATVEVSAIDDSGQTSEGNVRLTLAAGASRTVSAQDLESGAGLDGALGKGTGKWRLQVTSDESIRVMNLLESPTGHLSNLSTVAQRGSGSGGSETAYQVPLFPSARDPDGREGFVRVVNRSDEPTTVRIRARDDTRRSYEPIQLSLDPGAARQFNSHDLESGNADKGLSAGVGAGDGDWRLELSSQQDIVVGAYLRTADGFLTSMHDMVEETGEGFLVPTFNPARNVNQVSRLRLINLGTRFASVRVKGIDDLGRSLGDGATVPVGRGLTRTVSAQVLEEGLRGLTGAIGTGSGKWRLVVTSDVPLQVMSLLESPTGHLTNLSTRASANPGSRIPM